jgi:hypothetical protein
MAALGALIADCRGGGESTECSGVMDVAWGRDCVGVKPVYFEFETAEVILDRPCFVGGL